MNMNYVCFLRGINVGGNKKVDMKQLKKTFEALGFTNVKTLLNSGNVIFQEEQIDIHTLNTKIVHKLEGTFGFSIPVLVRSENDIKKLIASDPFKNISLTSKTRLYVTFMASKPQTKQLISYESSKKDFRILRVTNSEVCSVLSLSKTEKTADAMKILEKEYGKNITTRNWNTILKVEKLFV